MVAACGPLEEVNKRLSFLDLMTTSLGGPRFGERFSPAPVLGRAVTKPACQLEWHPSNG